MENEQQYNELEKLLNTADNEELVEFILLMVEEQNLDLTTALKHWRKEARK